MSDNPTPLRMLSKRLSVIYISPNFPYHRHGFELVELEELASLVNLFVVSLRRPSPGAWEWMTGRFSCRPGCDYVALNLVGVIRGGPQLLLNAYAGRASSKILWKAFARDCRGGLKTAIALMAGRHVGELALKCRADVIHADFASAPATVAFAAAEYSGIPFSFCGHAYDVFSSKPAGRATDLLLREKALAASAVFAANSGALLRLQNLTDGRSKCYLKRNGIRGFLCPPREDRGRRPFRVVGLGGLVEKKGFDILIEAVARLSKQGAELELAIYGEGPERARLERLAKSLAVPLKLPGAYRHAELDGILDNAAVVVLPSRILRDKDSDGVPTVFLEALRCGIPIIGADVGSVADIIRDGKTGWLVRSADVDDLVRAIGECMADYRHACELCKAGQELLVKEFKASNAAELMVRTWTRLGTAQ